MRLDHQRFWPILGIAILASSSPALAGGDKMSLSFTNHVTPGTDGTPFKNCTSTGAYKSSGTQIQIQLKGLVGLTDTDGIICTDDDFICVTHTETNGVLFTGPSTVIFRAEVKKGQLKVKHDLCAENAATCLPIPLSSVALDAKCFGPDPDFDETNGGTLTALGMTNPCDFIVPGAKLEPSSTEIARTGTTSGCPE